VSQGNEGEQESKHIKGWEKTVGEKVDSCGESEQALHPKRNRVEGGKNSVKTWKARLRRGGESNALEKIIPSRALGGWDTRGKL